MACSGFLKGQDVLSSFIYKEEYLIIKNNNKNLLNDGSTSDSVRFEFKMRLLLLVSIYIAIGASSYLLTASHICRLFEKLDLQVMPPQIQEALDPEEYFSSGGKLGEKIQNGFCFGWPNINPVVLKKLSRFP